MNTYRALRVVSSERRGSSRPIVVETEAGQYFTKVRGAAQGPGTLVAEIIVAALADALGLRVPSRSLIAIDDTMTCEDRDAELADLLRASYGLNLGFRAIDGATEFRAQHVDRVSPETASTVVWLDGLVMNPDRTARNPNMLLSRDDVWLIDHGATLRFQHKWSAVTEASPRRDEGPQASHILYSRATQVAAMDAHLAACLDRDVIRAAVGSVPDDFLKPLVAPPATSVALRRRRQAYLAFLWKRLKPPRPFGTLTAATRSGSEGRGGEDTIGKCG